jgi:flagellar operon protein
MTQTDLNRLDGAIARVREKGSRQALVLMDSRAFIVGAQSGTVVTALGGEDLQNHVFTNIDATVVA